jgi:predicted porin
MKLKLAAVAALVAATGAHAQSSNVVLYGILDAGVMTQNRTGATGTGGHDLAFTDGQLLPSIYGFKGTEDLGDGLHAGFELEGGFNSGNGTHNSPGVYQTQIFGRVAKVTLGGPWGSVGAGLQIDPALIASVGTEPREMTDSFSHLEHWILATVGNGAPTGALEGGIFDQNSVTYTYTGHGIYAGAEYGFGGIAGSQSANSTESLGLSYHLACSEGQTTAGVTGYCDTSGFIASAGFSEAKSPTPGVGKSSVIYSGGIGYEVAMVAVRAQYGDFKSGYAAGAAGDNVKSWGLGLDVKLGGVNLINLAYYQAKDNGTGPNALVPVLGPVGKTHEIALLEKYSLSKRSSLFAQVASVKASANSGLGADIGGVYVASGALTAPAGVTTTYIGLGLQHLF